MSDQPDISNMSPEQIAEMQKQQCIFCHIASGRVPAKKIFEDDKCVAILDINPAVKGHVILIPKEHYPVMALAPSEIVKHIFTIAKAVSNTQLKAFKEDGVDGTTIFVANGASAGQKAPHFMVHIIPRREGDKLEIKIPEYKANQELMMQVRTKMIDAVRKKLGSAYEIKEIDKPKKESKAEEEKEEEPEEDETEDAIESKENEDNEEKEDDEVSLDDITKLLR